MNLRKNSMRGTVAQEEPKAHLFGPKAHLLVGACAFGVAVQVIIAFPPVYIRRAFFTVGTGLQNLQFLKLKPHALRTTLGAVELWRQEEFHELSALHYMRVFLRVVRPCVRIAVEGVRAAVGRNVGRQVAGLIQNIWVDNSFVVAAAGKGSGPVGKDGCHASIRRFPRSALALAQKDVLVFVCLFLALFDDCWYNTISNAFALHLVGDFFALAEAMDFSEDVRKVLLDGLVHLLLLFNHLRGRSRAVFAVEKALHAIGHVAHVPAELPLGIRDRSLAWVVCARRMVVASEIFECNLYGRRPKTVLLSGAKTIVIFVVKTKDGTVLVAHFIGLCRNIDKLRCCAVKLAFNFLHAAVLSCEGGDGTIRVIEIV
jgi:hypothetical protein